MLGGASLRGRSFSVGILPKGQSTDCVAGEKGIQDTVRKNFFEAFTKKVKKGVDKRGKRWYYSKAVCERRPRRRVLTSRRTGREP